MTDGHTEHIDHLELLPNIPLFLILDYLTAHDFIALHVTSKNLFQKCSKYLNHIKIKHRLPKRRKNHFTTPLTIDNEKEAHKHRPNTYWDCSTVRRREQFPTYLYICIDVRKLNSHEISRIIGHYKGEMQYFLFQWSTAVIKFFPLSGIRLNYHHLERLCQNPNTNYKTVCELYQNIEIFTPIWTASTSELVQFPPGSPYLRNNDPDRPREI